MTEDVGRHGRYDGAFAPMIGHEDLLQPTRSRLLWLGVGLGLAVLLGFVLGFTLPRRRK